MGQHPKSSCLLLLLTFLLASTLSRSKELESTKLSSPRRVLFRNRRHKVRGKAPTSRNRMLQENHSGTLPSRSYYGSAFSNDLPKDCKESKREEESKTKSGKKKEKDKSKSKGPKCHKSQHSSSSSNSLKHSRSDNIFEHPEVEEIEYEITPVQCGSDESPFLSTFVVSIQLQQPEEISPYESGSRDKSSRKSQSKKSRSKKSSSSDEDDDLLPFDGLSPSEQRALEMAFRNVYNNLTYAGCDGFFRTTFSVSLTLVERDEDDGAYAVMLENRYRSDGTDETSFRVANGTLATNDDEGLRRRMTEGSNETTTYMYVNNSAPLKGDYEYYEEKGESPSTYVQTVSGGEDVPIYYVSLAATCRNCAVTSEVNFPLLMQPEDGDEHVGGNSIGMRQVEPITIFERQEVEDKDVCTCPLPVEDNEEETSRRRLNHRRRRRRLDGHALYSPPPNGPTAEQYVTAMNAAILSIQETQGKLLRVAGIVDLIEPDYFQGENPELVIPPTQAPTVSAMPTVSSAPSESPTKSPQPSVSPSELLQESSAPSSALTRRPTPPPASPPPTSSAATMRIVSVWGPLVPALWLLM